MSAVAPPPTSSTVLTEVPELFCLKRGARHLWQVEGNIFSSVGEVAELSSLTSTLREQPFLAVAEEEAPWPASSAVHWKHSPCPLPSQQRTVV